MPHLSNRRDAILSSLGALFVSGCNGTLDPPMLDADVPRSFIDAHCHVFDAHDIPVKPFLIQTALKEENIKQPWITLGKLLADATEIWSALGDPERDWAFGRAAALTSPTSNDEKVRFQDALEQAIRKSVAAGHGLRGGNRLHEMLAPQDRMVSEIAPNLFKMETGQGVFSLNWEAASILKLLDDFRIGHRSTSRVQSLLAGKPSDTIELRDLVSDTEILRLSRALAAEADTQNTDYGAVLYVASLLMRTRNGNIEQFDKSMGLAGATPPIVRLHVPALVDFDCWYGDAVTIRSLAIDEQCAIMAKIAKRQSDPNRFVNGYVAFDPLRALLVEAGILPGLAPLQTIKTAIEHQGFVGVKLYPPMGFEPIGNSPDNGSYGDSIKNWIQKLAARHPNTPYRLGPELDRVLIELYRYCLQQDVPIMAHCGDSQASVPLAGAKAGPKGWFALLDQREFRPLRINLAHFGSFWCHSADKPTSTGDDYSSSARCLASWSWTDDIMAALAKTDAEGPLYPNLYFDIGDMSEITTDVTAAGKLADMLKGYATSERALLASRFMYGTDWFFLALGGKQHVNYIPKVEALIQGTVTSASGFHANAARFLGLVSGSKTAGRLLDYYADNPARQNAFRALLL